VKSQSEIVALVSIAVLTISLISTAYFWGMPLIQKRQDSIKVDRLRDMFNIYNPNSLPYKIENLLITGSQQIFVSSIDGIWKLDENSITFQTSTKTTNVAPDIGWVSFYDSCDTNGNCNKNIGTLGTDKPFCICVNSTRAADFYLVSYKISLRNLTDNYNNYSYSFEFTTPSSNLKSLILNLAKEGNLNKILVSFR